MKQSQKGEVMVAMLVVMLVAWLAVGHGHMGMMGQHEHEQQEGKPTEQMSHGSAGPSSVTGRKF